MEASEWLALGLLLITGYYAWQSNLLNKVTKQTFELSHRPYLAFKSFHFNIHKIDDTTANIQGGIELENVGNVLLKFNVNSLRIILQDRTVGDPKFMNTGGYVYPKQNTAYRFDTIKNIDFSRFPISGTIEYELEYSSGTKKYISKKKSIVQIYENGAIDWINEFEYEE